MIRTRFAPSPTGYLHVGNARTALINYLFTKKNNGSFLLRIDDTDLERSKSEYEKQIVKDLEWLGIKWDLFTRQSERIELYNEYKKILIDKGFLYPCFETETELDIKRKMQLNSSMPPIYDREALRLTDKQKGEYKKENRKPHYRFFLKEGLIQWDDQIRGHVTFESSKLSDPIVVREDGSMTYLLTSVIDDVEFKISNIIRGEDHVTNSALQVQMFKALGNIMPNIAHLPLISHKEGKISKRKGGFEINSLRERYIENMTINSFFAKIGTSDSIKIYNNLSQLVEEFDIEKFGKSPANFSDKEIDHLNQKLLHNLSFEEIKPSLDNFNFKIDENFWSLIKGNLENLGQIEKWQKICKFDIEPVIKDKAFLDLSAKLFPKGDLNENSWNEWIENIKLHSDKRGKDLFLPLRMAITSDIEGPEMKILLPLIGREKILKRLSGQIG